MINPYRVIYGTYSSRDFDLICELSFEGDSGATSTFLSRESVASDTYKGEFKRVHGYKHTEVLAPTITFIDKNFGDFTLERQRKILKWLTSNSAPSFLTVYHDDSEVVSYEILGGFTEINTYKMGNGRVVGFTAVFESISPFAFSPLRTFTKDVSDLSNRTLTFNVSNDNPQSLIYPCITIQQKSEDSVVEVASAMTRDNMVKGTVYHCESTNMYYWLAADGTLHEDEDNKADFETTSVVITVRNSKDELVSTSVVKNNIKGERIVIDGTNKVVSSDRDSGRVFGDDFDFRWIGLFDGKNTISAIGNCTITIEYREPIKCGEF
jgi:hypothetical protein